jgi:hypothetical protein
MTTLSERQKIILSLVVHEHIKGSQAVASGALIRDYKLKISSATVRAELNTLTELGYLRQPHTSAGRVPTEEGYRYFVNNLLNQSDLPATTRNTINHQFYQSDKGSARMACPWLPRCSPRKTALCPSSLPLISERVAFRAPGADLGEGFAGFDGPGFSSAEKFASRLLSLDNIYTQNQLSDLAQKINNGCENFHAR